MQINVESLSSIKKKLNFVIPAERVSVEVDKAYGEIRKHAAIKGFRKGKVPMGIIEKHYAEKMAEDVLKSLVHDTYFKAVAEQGLNPVSYPVIESDTLTPGQAFSYSATVEIFPEVEVKEYRGLEVKKEKLELDASAVDERLKEMQQSMAQLAPAPAGHAAAMGDFVTFDFKGSIDGVPFEGGEAEDFQLELGSGRFIPGFEDQMVGVTAGSQRDINVTFPENYGAEHLKGKAAVFAIDVKEIKVKELPEINDEFAKEFGPFETLDELKQKLVEVQKAQEEQRVESELRDRLMKELIEKNDLDVPEALVDRQVTLMLENAKQRLASQRLSLEVMGMTEESYKARFRDDARQQVKGSLLLDALADKESIEVSDADIDEQIAAIAAGTKQELETVAKLYKQNARAKENLVAQIREDKAVQFLVENARIVEVPKSEI